MQCICIYIYIYIYIYTITTHYGNLNCPVLQLFRDKAVVAEFSELKHSWLDILMAMFLKVYAAKTVQNVAT